VASSHPDGDAADTRPPHDQYTDAVRNEIRRLQAYFARQITRYRIARTVIIISAALVPVLATATQVPRWVLAAFGALAAVTEGIRELYQLRTSALNAMRTANALERVLNKYMTAVAPYDGTISQSFPIFVRDVEAIRADTDKAFLQTWQAAEVRHTAAGEIKGRAR
jgi:hypothetical protein